MSVLLPTTLIMCCFISVSLPVVPISYRFISVLKSHEKVGLKRFAIRFRRNTLVSKAFRHVSSQVYFRQLLFRIVLVSFFNLSSFRHGSDILRRTISITISILYHSVLPTYLKLSWNVFWENVNQNIRSIGDSNRAISCWQFSGHETARNSNGVFFGSSSTISTPAIPPDVCNINIKF